MESGFHWSLIKTTTIKFFLQNVICKPIIHLFLNENSSRLNIVGCQMLKIEETQNFGMHPVFLHDCVHYGPNN